MFKKKLLLNFGEERLNPDTKLTTAVYLKKKALKQYCRVDRKGTGASRQRGGRARDFVNFRKLIHASRVRGAPARV